MSDDIDEIFEEAPTWAVVDQDTFETYLVDHLQWEPKRAQEESAVFFMPF